MFSETVLVTEPHMHSILTSFCPVQYFCVQLDQTSNGHVVEPVGRDQFLEYFYALSIFMIFMFSETVFALALFCKYL